MRKRTYYINAVNKMKGKYKMFALFPALTICRDTQALELGYTSWELYLEWLWFQLEFMIETEEETLYNTFKSETK
jgi:hypothetical protein